LTSASFLKNLALRDSKSDLYFRFSRDKASISADFSLTKLTWTLISRSSCFFYLSLNDLEIFNKAASHK
jgi:hypothetical protein